MSSDLPVVASDFEFKDTRDYVNAATQIEGAWKAASTDHRYRWSRPRVDATFTKPVTSNGHFYLSATRSGLPAVDSLAAWFRIFEGEDNVWVGFVAAESVAVDRRVRTNRRVVDLRLAAPFAGHCVIATGSMSDVLENLVEANKQIHLKTVAATGVPIVVNVYMRGVPLMPAAGLQDVAVTIENLVVREAGAVTTTLNRLTCPELQSEPFEIAYLLRFSERS